MVDVEQNIAQLLSEERVFEPPADFTAQAIVKDRSVYERAGADYQGFWAEQAELLAWSRRWDTVLEWTPPHGQVVRGRQVERLPQLPGQARRGRRR